MRRRFDTLLAALVMAAAALWLNAIALPTPAFACSCAPPPSLVEAAARPGTAVVLGTVGRPMADATTVAIEGAFSGFVAGNVVVARGVTDEGSMCGLGAMPGERWVPCPASAGCWCYRAGTTRPTRRATAP